MIRIVKGNLLESDCDVIIHQANSFATMGAGFAKQLVAKYPKALDTDKEFSIPVGSPERLGNYSDYTAPDGVTVVNMYSQYRWGRGTRQTDYKAMETALRNILRDVEGEKVGVPYQIGCGLAGGDWDTVKGILETVSNEIGRDIYMYKL